MGAINAHLWKKKNKAMMKAKKVEWRARMTGTDRQRVKVKMTETSRRENERLQSGQL